VDLKAAGSGQAAARGRGRLRGGGGDDWGRRGTTGGVTGGGGGARDGGTGGRKVTRAAAVGDYPLISGPARSISIRITHRRSRCMAAR
jgi:hypothetical protein